MKISSKTFEEVAKMLPKKQTHFLNPRKVTGAEILSWNTISKINGDKIEPEKEYWYKEHVYIEHNHAKLLYKHFKNGGIEACNHYIETCIANAKQTSNEAQMIGVFSLVQEKIKADINNGNS